MRAAILDVDGVVLDSPHERAWREALADFADPARLTSALYQAHMAGKPRLDGARAVLAQLGVANPAQRAPDYAARKQARLLALIDARAFAPFPDALRFIQALRGRDIRLAAASSSKNASRMLQAIPVGAGRSLLDLFDRVVCGRDLPAGKPDPAIFLLAASELGIAPGDCLVVEDAPAGIAAAKAGGMRALGVARHADAGLLLAAGADLVVTSLDEIAIDGLASGNLRTRTG